jgi:hypothetical protein
VRRLVKIALVVFGIRAFLRWRKSRQEREAAAEAQPAPDPADELRRKLAESRVDDGLGEAPATPPEASVAGRRAEVHEQGRAALDEMTSSDED